MKRLEPPDTHHLAAAEGWLELGNPGEAEEEIRWICYACQLGRLAEAVDWLKDAARLSDHKTIKLMALDDADLQPLRKAIAEM